MELCSWCRPTRLVFLTALILTAHSLHFTSDVYDSYVSESTPPNTLIQQLVAIPFGSCNLSRGDKLAYSIQNNSHVSVNEVTGDVSVLSYSNLSLFLSHSNSNTVSYRVTAKCGLNDASAELRVSKSTSECICFPSGNPLHVQLSQPPSSGPPHGLLYLDTARCGGEQAYSVSSDDSALRIEGNRLLMTGSSNEPIRAVISCSRSNSTLALTVNQTKEPVFAKPYILYKNNIRRYFTQYNVTVDPQQINSSLNKVYDKPLFSAARSQANQTVEWFVQKLNDPNNQFSVSQAELVRVPSTMPLYKIVIRWSNGIKIRNSTDIDIVIFDKKLLDPSAAHLQRANNVTFRIRLTYNDIDELFALKLLSSYNLSVYRSAPFATQLLRVDHNLSGALLFNLTSNDIDSNCAKFTSVTPHQGIIYVSSHSALNSCRAAEQALTLTVTQSTKNRTSLINIQISDEPASAAIDPPQSSQVSCANNRDRETCESASGLGTQACMWKTVLDSKSNFSTCVSSPSCADYECNELENLDSKICPQDCQGNWYGHHRPECGLGAIGICRAEGVCFCDGSGKFCQCQHKSHVSLDDDEDYMYGYSGDGDSKSDGVLYGETLKEPVCDMMCMVAISVVAALAILLVVVLCLWCRFKSLKQSRKGPGINAWRVNGNNLHLTFTSCPDYEQSTPTTIISSLSDWPDPVHSYHNTGSMELFDQKWELDRENLLLQDYIGEGEFGRVMRAKYRQSPSHGWSTVAVKMLKDGASRTEYRDLLSEYNLLKEVDHPNVIRLIGAATLNGPFHLVVEYCEHGSLKNLLRTIHNGEPTYINNQTQFFAAHAAHLLSFACQISKGMQYLSDIKLVHRDLATRNILIATDDVVKISDFGMTKDVYEEDAYKKKSQGRIPVKWMAPESLYRHIYTSKSDVWSFGIVLWEIATLGATPYPGIAAERMCQMLQDGYRMERPESCSIVLYSLMRQCWNYDPVCRPTFRDLNNSLQKLINDQTDCLDLSLACTRRMCAGSSTSSGSVDEITDPQLTEALLSDASTDDISSKFIDDYEVSHSWPIDQKQNTHRYTTLDLEDE